MAMEKVIRLPDGLQIPMTPEKLARLDRMAKELGLDRITSNGVGELLGHPLRYALLDASLEIRQLFLISTFLFPGLDLMALATDVESLVEQLAAPDLPLPDLVIADPTGLCAGCVVTCLGDEASCPLLSRRDLIAKLPPILLFVRQGDLKLACRAMAVGVKGFQLHRRGLMGLRDAALAVVQGGIWIDPDLSTELTHLLRSRMTEPSKVGEAGDADPLLSEREKEVLLELEHGLLISEVASKLVLSENTIKTHLRRIYEKLDVDNRQDAVMRARLTGQLV